MFKRRKPEEPIAMPSGTAPLPGQPAVVDDAAPDASGLRPVPGPSSDSGLGVPPFRPAPPKEAPVMSRPPLSTATPQMPSATPAARPAGSMAPRAVPDVTERRTLVVGRGISVQGVVQDAERLVVEGTVEASMIHATELSIMVGGVFKGEVEVEDAEIAGTIDGTLTARGSLIVRTTGRVLGTARCRRLQVEDGGQITGRIEMITGEAKSDLPPRPVPATDTAAE